MASPITIGLVDDDADRRGTAAKTLRRRLEREGYRVIDRHPFASVDDYSSWISEEAISALIIDWRLNLRGDGQQPPVAYEGDQVVNAVHRARPFFPIFVLTAYAPDPDVLEHNEHVEIILDRIKFSRDPAVLIARVRRASGRYSSAQQEKLDRIAELAETSAVRQLTSGERKELHALQEELRIAFDPNTPLTEGTALEAGDEVVGKCEDLIRRIEEALEDGGKNDRKTKKGRK